MRSMRSMRRPWLGASGLAVLVGACGSFLAPGPQPAVPVGPLGPIVQNPLGGPPVECRGIAPDQCLSLVNPDVGDMHQGPILRVIVTCTTNCTPERGEASIDVLEPSGRVVNIGNAGYVGGG